MYIDIVESGTQVIASGFCFRKKKIVMQTVPLMDRKVAFNVKLFHWPVSVMNMSRWLFFRNNWFP